MKYLFRVIAPSKPKLRGREKTWSPLKCIAFYCIPGILHRQNILLKLLFLWIVEKRHTAAVHLYSSMTVSILLRYIVLEPMLGMLEIISVNFQGFTTFFEVNYIYK